MTTSPDIVFFLLFVVGMLYLPLWFFLFFHIKSKHPQKFAELGNPTLTDIRPELSREVMRLLYTNAHLGYRDKVVTACIYIARSFGVIYVMVFGYLVILIFGDFSSGKMKR